MSEKVTAVALFFDDADLGSHLRNALSEHGARIEHEGPIGSFDEAALRSAEVDVLVVNLDDTVDDAALDRIYDLVQSGETPVVFNDAQASQKLDGWDRARWARHLAAKVLNRDIIDPPRPDNAREVEVPVAPEPADEPVSEVHDPLAAQPLVHDGSGPDSDTLEAELEALLAEDAVDAPASRSPASASTSYASDELEDLDLESLADAPHDQPEHAPFGGVEHAGAEFDEPQSEAFTPLHDDDLAALGLHDGSDDALPDFDDSFGSGLKFHADDELPPLHDGNFGQSPLAAHEHATSADSEEQDDSDLNLGSDAAPTPLHDIAFGEHDAHLLGMAAEARPVEKVRFDIDHLSLADDVDVAPVQIVKENLAQQTAAPAAPEWDFLTDEDYLPPPKKEFGVEKVSAADYLAPDAEEQHDSPQIKPGLSLELVSNAEAVAPTLHQEAPAAQEMRLHEVDTLLTHLLVLGASRDGSASLQAFLAALPADVKVPVLLTQHQAEDSADHLAQALATHSAMPIKVAAAGARACAGQILLVPRGQHVRVLRDGRLDITAVAETAEPVPSIDGSFTMAANVFGRDALAIVFAGRSTDAVAGAQAIHDRGGQVWVESSSTDDRDMVHGVLAEKLASFSGSPQELAARLVEDFR